MNLIYTFFLFLLTSILLFSNNTYANINLTISPIKYEIEAEPWQSITRTAKLINLSDTSFFIKTWSSDFESKWNDWKPSFIIKDSNNLTWQEISDWITISQDQFEIWPKEEKDIEFTIKIPYNATPGWHYWAVFFKHKNSKSSWQISINLDYWVLVLVNVAWEIVSKATILDFLIINKNSIANRKEIDSCFFNLDLTGNKYDKKCLNISIDFLKASLLNINIDEGKKDKEDKEEKQFLIEFEIPIENEWNTHIKPIWEIKLIDENWKEIKSIWKKVIQNDKWAIIWEEIVNFLPVNDTWWNVLPSTKRVFNTSWKWFPYKGYDVEWNPIIQYWTPNEFYSQKNIEWSWLIMPWERLNERLSYKNITAKLEVVYNDHNWEKIEFNSAKEFSIEYKEKYIWLNPIVIIGSILFILMILITWLIFKKKKIKCIWCNKKLEEDMKICPYCEVKQKNKKSKKSKKQ